MKKGDIILVPFPFTDLTDRKTRPALVLFADIDDVTVAFITSKVIKKQQYDIEINPSATNGLKRESYIKIHKLATIEKKLALGELGKISKAEIIQVNKSLKQVFDIK